MESVIGALIVFAIEVLFIALLLAPRWTLRMLARPFRALAERIRGNGRSMRGLGRVGFRRGVLAGGTTFGVAMSKFPIGVVDGSTTPETGWSVATGVGVGVGVTFGGGVGVGVALGGGVGVGVGVGAAATGLVAAEYRYARSPQ